MRFSILAKILIAPTRWVLVILLLGLAGSPAQAGLIEGQKTVDGLTIYLGVVPAGNIQSHPPNHPEARMHGGPPPSSFHNVHLVAAVFQQNSGVRVTNVVVSARISGQGNRGRTIRLTPMTVNGALTFGGYTSLGTQEDVMISIDVIRPRPTPHTRTTTAQFQYAHD